MDRSLAGRVGIGRPFAPSKPRRVGRGWWRPFSTVAGLTRAASSFVWRQRRLRIGLLTVLVALALLAGGWLWLRDSPLVLVERVQISGVHGPDAGAIDAALAKAARHMSTLNVRAGMLRSAVAPYRVVREVRATPSFPHGLHIHVVEQLPVAALTVTGGRTAVAADGVLLGPALLSGSLPVLGGGLSHSAVGQLTGARVHGASLLDALTVLGAAPAPLQSVLTRAYMGPEGVTVVMRSGPLVYFGDASRPHAKWLSLARVLADPTSAGASYVDVRLPERPAAGFAGTAAPHAGTTDAEPASASEPATASELAAGLTAGLGGGSSPASATGQGEASTGAAHAEATPSAPAPASSSAATETNPAPAPESPAVGPTPIP
jgi:cell division protein FtsQ